MRQHTLLIQVAIACGPGRATATATSNPIIVHLDHGPEAIAIGEGG